MKIYTKILIIVIVQLSLSAQLVKIAPDSSAVAFTSNKVHFSFSNSGTLADISGWIENRGIKFNNIPTIYSAGFYLSGFINDKLWLNGVAPASLVQDYLPGKVNSSPNSKVNKIYPLFSTDKPFSQNWREWKKAVDQGAYYYDGDKNGLYDPIDHNQNGLWEINEDRPGLMYDQTYFTVYNDAVPEGQRRFYDVEPLGIEIRQTIFASDNLFGLDNSVFVRYSISNTGLKADTLSEVIFSMWLDPDLGDYTDDLVGCDTTLNSGFTYNDGPDTSFGEKTPVLYSTFVQTPLRYTGSPTDTAIIRFNNFFDGKKMSGFINTNLSAHTNYAFSHSGYIFTKETQRNVMLGKYFSNELIDPCNHRYSQVFHLDCEKVNPLFWFSGDPDDSTGWINTFSTDQRQLISTGLFELIKDQPQEIIIAYTIGEGYNNVSAFDVTRARVKEIFDEYNANFPNSFIISDLPSDPEKLKYQYTLEQNYPNPFNPITKIRFTIYGTNYLSDPSKNTLTNTELSIHDVLGRKVAMLVNEPKAPGSYEVPFDASQFASGVYFYRLTAGDFVQTKKMILIK